MRFSTRITLTIDRGSSIKSLSTVVMGNLSGHSGIMENERSVCKFLSIWKLIRSNNYILTQGQVAVASENASLKGQGSAPNYWLLYCSKSLSFINQRRGRRHRIRVSTTPCGIGSLRPRRRNSIRLHGARRETDTCKRLTMVVTTGLL